jgi:hypothetical protein
MVLGFRPRGSAGVAWDVRADVARVAAGAVLIGRGGVRSRRRARAALAPCRSGACEPEVVAVEFEQVAAGGDQSPFRAAGGASSA